MSTFCAFSFLFSFKNEMLSIVIIISSMIKKVISSYECYVEFFKNIFPYLLTFIKEGYFLSNFTRFATNVKINDFKRWQNDVCQVDVRQTIPKLRILQ